MGTRVCPGFEHLAETRKLGFKATEMTVRLHLLDQAVGRQPSVAVSLRPTVVPVSTSHPGPLQAGCVSKLFL